MLSLTEHLVRLLPWLMLAGLTEPNLVINNLKLDVDPLPR